MIEFADLTEAVDLVESPWADLPRKDRVATITGGDYLAADVLGDLESYSHRSGDSALAGHLCLDRPDSHGYMVFDGSLKVSGILCLSVWDTTNVIVVTGDLEAEALILDSDVWLFVLGDAILRGPFVAKLSDSGVASFAGKLKAACLVRPGGRGDIVVGGGDELEADELDAAAFPDVAAVVDSLRFAGWRDDDDDDDDEDDEDDE